MKLSMFICALALGALSWYTVLFVAVPVIKYDMAQWRSENECIAYHIARGVERKNILRNSGDCTVITPVNH